MFGSDGAEVKSIAFLNIHPFRPIILIRLVFLQLDFRVRTAFFHMAETLTKPKVSLEKSKLCRAITIFHCCFILCKYQKYNRAPQSYGIQLGTLTSNLKNVLQGLRMDFKHLT